MQKTLHFLSQGIVPLVSLPSLSTVQAPNAMRGEEIKGKDDGDEILSSRRHYWSSFIDELLPYCALCRVNSDDYWKVAAWGPLYPIFIYREYTRSTDIISRWKNVKSAILEINEVGFCIWFCILRRLLRVGINEGSKDSMVRNTDEFRILDDRYWMISFTKFHNQS